MRMVSGVLTDRRANSKKSLLLPRAPAAAGVCVLGNEGAGSRSRRVRAVRVLSPPASEATGTPNPHLWTCGSPSSSAGEGGRTASCTGQTDSASEVQGQKWRGCWPLFGSSFLEERTVLILASGVNWRRQGRCGAHGREELRGDAPAGDFGRMQLVGGTMRTLGKDKDGP